MFTKKEIQQLKGLLSGPSTSAAKPQKQKKGKKKNKKQSVSRVLQEGSIRLTRKEILRSVDKIGGDFIEMIPSNTLLPFLFSLMSNYTEIIWHKLVFHYASGVGTTTDGLLYLGFKWGAVGLESITQSNVTALSPCLMCPVWKNCVMPLQSSKLMTRKTYLIGVGDKIDQLPGTLFYYVSSSTKKTYGSIWVEYDATLLGPKG